MKGWSPLKPLSPRVSRGAATAPTRTGASGPRSQRRPTQTPQHILTFPRFPGSGLISFPKDKSPTENVPETRALGRPGLTVKSETITPRFSTETPSAPARFPSFRSAQPGCRGPKPGGFEKWTLTRSGYRNRIPRGRSPSGTGPGGSPEEATPGTGTKGRKAAQTKGPRQGAWGGGRARAGRSAGGAVPPDRCGREGAGGGGGPSPSRPPPAATAARALSLPRTATPWRNQERDPSLRSGRSRTPGTSRSLFLAR